MLSKRNNCAKRVGPFFACKLHKLSETSFADFLVTSIK